MPRKSRIDAPGALHHIIGRGIARGAVFLGDVDRDDFLTQEEVMRPGRVRGRLGAKARSLLCYWATMELGMKQSRLADVLHLTQPAISVAAKRGEEVIKESGYSLKE